MPLNVQVLRYIDALRKQLGVQGHTGLNLVDDCLPVWPMYDDRPESFLLREERRYSIAFSQAAVAGQYGRLHFTLPAGNRSLVVLETIRSKTTDLIWGWDSVGGATPVGAIQRLDSRNNQPPELIFTADTNAADSLLASLGQAQAGFEIQPAIVMWSSPGTARSFGVRTYAVNQQLDCTLMWREFVPSDEELRG